MSQDTHTLFRLYACSIRQFLQRQGLGRETAEDLTQDVFLRMLARGTAQDAPSRDAQGPDVATIPDPRAYLFRISRNLMIDHWRSEQRRPVFPLGEHELARIADPAPDAERQYLDRERLRRTAAALETMPARTRQVFELHRLGGQSLAAIASETGLSTTRIWMLVHEAYRHIRRHLQED